MGEYTFDMIQSKPNTSDIPGPQDFGTEEE